jgi:hypothetical protein
MDGGSFTRDILMLDRIEYASPLPLLPPITAPISTQPPASGTREGSLTVSPWTIGAVLAMCKLEIATVVTFRAGSNELPFGQQVWEGLWPSGLGLAIGKLEIVGICSSLKTCRYLHLSNYIVRNHHGMAINRFIAPFSKEIQNIHLTSSENKRKVRVCLWKSPREIPKLVCINDIPRCHLSLTYLLLSLLTLDCQH